MTGDLMPTMRNYGDYSSNNYGFHTIAMTYRTQKRGGNINTLTLYYSYETIIAFVFNGNLTISRNIWGTTTGKHLNFIDCNKPKRIDNDLFNKELKKALKRM